MMHTRLLQSEQAPRMVASRTSPACYINLLRIIQ